MRSLYAAALVGFLSPLTLGSSSGGSAKVLVPGGYRTNTNIHEIPAGGRLARVGSEIHILAANGTVVHKATSGAPRKSQPIPAREFRSGWITYAFWLNPDSSPVTSFTTTWDVPAIPATDHGQTVFLFNAMQPVGSSEILQPVLQYGPSAAGGGAFWSVATWHIDSVNTFFTPLIRSDPGTALDAVITLTSQEGSSFGYNSQFTNVAGTSLDVGNLTELNWASETLEAYGITTKSDYPAGSTVLHDINMKLENSAPANVAWSHDNDDADGLSTSIDTDGATNGQITFVY
ncbi:hypothetical protein C8R43DRAFT_1113160 [Mycena crocata]|nr:hypothetical protein C8R43DRAFT_1113160 [Mycena crocata]